MLDWLLEGKRPEEIVGGIWNNGGDPGEVRDANGDLVVATT
jgi:hypothetical protein